LFQFSLQNKQRPALSKGEEFAGNMSARADRVKHVFTYSALASYAGIILVVWAEARSHPAAIAGLGSHFYYAFASFAWLLAPLWFCGFGAGEWLRGSIHSRTLRVLLPTLLGIALVFAIPAGDVRGTVVALLFGLPVILAALLEFAHLPPKLTWQDAAVFTILGAIYRVRWLTAAWSRLLSWRISTREPLLMGATCCWPASRECSTAEHGAHRQLLASIITHAAVDVVWSLWFR
jgi:hypothetical protein